MFATPTAAERRNALTVDVEDYFQVSAFEAVVSRTAWNRFESRVGRNTERILELFESHGVHATFFVLGWVAERFPELVRQIAALGHEVASHGFHHQLVYHLTPAQFRDDLRRARIALETATGRPVLGYRAPSFSITERSEWAFDVLAEEGYVYDASVFPIRHHRYGSSAAPRHPYRVVRDAGTLWEIPVSTIRWFDVNLPAGGGGYFRILPYQWTRFAIKRLNQREQRPAVFYIHPWELDPDQPKLVTGGFNEFRHYRNLDKTESRLKRLLSEFKFGSIEAMLGEQPEWSDARIVVSGESPFREQEVTI